MNRDLTQSPIAMTILKMAFPMSWGILSVIGFNIADTYFIGQLGTLELAAISLTFPVVMIFFSITLGIGTGVSSVVARSLGENDHHKVKAYTTDALILAVLLVGVFVVLGFLFLKPIFYLVGATDTTYPLVKSYMEIWLSGMIMIVVPIVGNGPIRAQGDMKTASLIMIIAAVTNIALDPLFIYGYGPIPALGVKGAAIATVLARMTTFFASLWVLHFKYQMIDFSIPSMKRFTSSLRDILAISIPTIGSNLLLPVAMVLITGLVARMGEGNVAAYGIVNRIESFAFIFVMAISSSVAPIVGQSFGAQKLERVKKTLSTSFVLAMISGGVMAFLLIQLGQYIIPLFNSDEQVASVGEAYFLIVPITFGFYGIRLITTSALNAIGKPLVATKLVLINLCLLHIPFSFLGAYFIGLKGVFYAQALSNIIIGIISFKVVRKTLGREVVLKN